MNLVTIKLFYKHLSMNKINGKYFIDNKYESVVMPHDYYIFV